MSPSHARPPSSSLKASFLRLMLMKIDQREKIRATGIRLAQHSTQLRRHRWRRSRKVQGSASFFMNPDFKNDDFVIQVVVNLLLLSILHLRSFFVRLRRVGSNIVKGLSEERTTIFESTNEQKGSSSWKCAFWFIQDLYQEIENLRDFLTASKQRGLKLQVELSECKGSQSERQTEIKEKRCEVDEMTRKVGVIEVERRSQNDQGSTMSFGF